MMEAICEIGQGLTGSIAGTRQSRSCIGLADAWHVNVLASAACRQYDATREASKRC